MIIRNALTKIIQLVVGICHKHNIEVVLMGGIAVSFYIRPRATYDVDVIIWTDKDKMDRFLKAIRKKGFSCDRRNPIKHIQNLSFIPLYFKKDKIYVDMFIAGNEFQRGIIKRAKSIEFGNIKVNIISPEDLILLKLLTGRQRDTDDARNIIYEKHGTLDFRYIKNWAERFNVRMFLEDEIRSLGIRI